MKDFFKIRTPLTEEHGAGEQGTPSLVAKYKKETPGQSGSAPTGQQPARKGDKLNAKFEPVKEAYAGKNPDNIKSVGSAGQGMVVLTTNAGAKHTISAKDTGGKMPKPGEPISKYAKEDEDMGEAMSHQANTTMKHVKNPTAGERKAAKDIKPGVAGYRDRIAMLRSAQARGGLKKESVEESLDEGYKEQDDMYRKEAVKHAERVMKAISSGYISGCKYHARSLQDMADEMENTIEYRKNDEKRMKALKTAGMSGY